MSKVKQRMAGVALAVTASVGIAAGVAGPAAAASGSYIATYQYLYQCQNTGAMYVHYDGASYYNCYGNGAVGFSLYVTWEA
jgi:hypothetical protein